MLARVWSGGYFKKMRKSQILWAFLGAFALLCFALASMGAFAFLWVFPLDAASLPLWMILCALDVLLAVSGFAFVPKARLLLWCCGLGYFSARQGVPWLGVALIGGSSFLWAVARSGRNLLVWVAGLAGVLFLFGHDHALLNAGMMDRLSSIRFSLHLLSAFALFRMISWAIAVGARGDKPDFFSTMEYFIAPAFWLSPMHAAHLVFDHMQPISPPWQHARACGWIARGFLHALIFSWLAAFLLPRLEARFEAGLSSFLWWEWVLLGPILFLIAYFEKSRVSYIVAGLLNLTGRAVSPDFRAPWRAKSLPEYWRRFHYWVWEYYIDYIYMPLSAFLRRKLSVRAASLAALFLTFSAGTSLVHWVHYPAPFLMALVLGIIFGLFTLLHSLAEVWLSNPKIGIPVTWVSVFFLYALAYPVYGLGWGWREIIQFLGR